MRRREGGWSLKMRHHHLESSKSLDHDPPCSTVKWWHQEPTEWTLCGQLRHNSRWKMDKSCGRCGFKQARLSGCLSLSTSMIRVTLSWHVRIGFSLMDDASSLSWTLGLLIISYRLTQSLFYWGTPTPQEDDLKKGGWGVVCYFTHTISGKFQLKKNLKQSWLPAFWKKIQNT